MTQDMQDVVDAIREACAGQEADERAGFSDRLRVFLDVTMRLHAEIAL